MSRRKSGGGATVDEPIGTWFGPVNGEPVPALAVPGSVGSGFDPALQLVDQVVRGRRVVGRCGAGAALCGVRVANNNAPVQVTVTLRLDSGAVDWWQRGRPTPAALPRLVVVSAQGILRQGVLLSLDRSGAGTSVTARVAFTVAAVDLPADGLLLVEVADAAAALPRGLVSAFAPAGPVGLRIDHIDVAPAPVDPHGREIDGPDIIDRRTAEWSGVVSTGGIADGQEDPGTAHSPYVVVNPSRGALPRCVLRFGLRSGLSTGLLRRVWPDRTRALSADEVTLRATALRDGRDIAISVAAQSGLAVVNFPATHRGPALLSATARSEDLGRQQLVAAVVEVTS